jgi:hypothetical protein
LTASHGVNGSAFVDTVDALALDSLYYTVCSVGPIVCRLSRGSLANGVDVVKSVGVYDA